MRLATAAQDRGIAGRDHPVLISKNKRVASLSGSDPF